MNIKKYILGVDFGTTHACARLYSLDLKPIGSCSSRLDQDNLTRERHELDPEAAWNFLCKIMHGALANANATPEQVRCVGISVQRNSFLLWNKETSAPISPVITWQDLRSTSLVRQLNNNLLFRSLRASGRWLYRVFRLPRLKALASYRFKTTLACVRLKHLLDEHPEFLSGCNLGTICYGCLETWFLWRLTKGQSFLTDVSCASVSGMYDPFKRKWSSFILNGLNIPARILPDVKPTSYLYGFIRDGPLQVPESASPVPVTAIIGDAQAATLAEGCLHPGQAKLTLGTGSFLNFNTGQQVHVLMDGFYPVIGWASGKSTSSLPSGSESCSSESLSSLTYLLEGNHIHTGSTIDWLRTQGYFQRYTELEEMLCCGDQLQLDEVTSLRGSFYVPLTPNVLESVCFNSLDVRQGPDGVLVRSNDRASEIERLIAVRVVVESVALTVCQMLERCRKEAGLSPSKLRVNGNVNRSDWLMQRLADVLGIPVERSAFEESSCLGAAIAAGVGAGVWPSYAAAITALHSDPTRGDRISPVETNEDSSQTSSRYLFRPNLMLTERMQRRYLAWCRARTRFITESQWKSSRIRTFCEKSKHSVPDPLLPVV